MGPIKDGAIATAGPALPDRVSVFLDRVAEEVSRIVPEVIAVVDRRVVRNSAGALDGSLLVSGTPLSELVVVAMPGAGRREAEPGVGCVMEVVDAVVPIGGLLAPCRGCLLTPLLPPVDPTVELAGLIPLETAFVTGAAALVAVFATGAATFDTVLPTGPAVLETRLTVCAMVEVVGAVA